MKITRRKSPAALGTILPTRASLAADDVFFDRQQIRRRKFAAKCPALKGCTVVKVAMETRYYKTPKLYCVLGGEGQNGFRLCWMEIRADGYSYGLRT